ncbi:FxsA family protein [Desulfovibrio litoralis]|uniref:FxsA membrane protein n=1 Tax=Desulfovibrio litoralis DSM 11393 TaxID=1121455 RepID=A0A1M7TK32_9BACT|nr:FxsA family protein [Desulfovibrio litoralis]SHN71070.1 FxsA membrane protein [Desulfovibrio litoralis DSM 11393]
MPFLILFIIYMYLEFTITRLVGIRLGFGNTMALMLVSAFLGVFLIKRQSTKALQEALNAQASGLATAMGSGFLRAFAYLVSGILFIIPGFFSDIIGFLLLMPFVQHLFADRFQNYRTKNPNGWSGSSFFYSSNKGWQSTSENFDSAYYNQNIGRSNEDPDVVDTTARENVKKTQDDNEIIIDCYVNEEKTKSANENNLVYMECELDDDQDKNKK